MDECQLIQSYLISESKLPKGWSKDSVAKFAKTIGKNADEKGFFDL